MKNRITIYIVFVTFLICITALLPLTRLRTVTHAQGPAIEVACPSGATALPAGIIINPATGKIRQLLCMDVNGNVSIPTASLNVASTFSITNSAGQQAITFTANDLTLSTFGGQNIKLNNPLTFSGSTFSGLGTVPAAGVGTKYCIDCTTASPCAGSGTGHLAVSNGTNWTCQ